MAYGLAEMPLQIAALPVAALVPHYYGADLGVSLGAMSIVMLVSKGFDAVSDPVVGWLSDHTNTPWGRRRVWMVAAVPIMMLAVYKLYMPGPGVDEFYLLFWLLALWLGWTMLFIPYYAWGAEITPDYHERTRVTGWRAFAGMVANFSGKLIPFLAGIYLAMTSTGDSLWLVGIMTLILLPLTVGATVIGVPEGRDYLPTRIPIVPGLRIMWRNRPFLRLVLAFFVQNFGSSISTVLVAFYISDVVQEQATGALTMLFLSVYYGSNLLSIPCWLWLAKRFGKHKCWCVSLFVFSALQSLYLLLGSGDYYYMLPITACTGFLGGTFRIMPDAMKADVIDLDTLESGEDRAASYFAIWSFMIKVALSIGPAVALMTLELLGYVAELGPANASEDIWAVQLLFALGPATGFALAALIGWRYPLDAKRHGEVQKALAQMRKEIKS